MRPVIPFVRILTPTERQHLQQGLRSTDAFTLRRCQTLLASVAGQTPASIARTLGCTPTTDRNIIHAFAAQGLACLRQKSSRPHSARPILGAAFDAAVRHLPPPSHRRSPRLAPSSSPPSESANPPPGAQHPARGLGGSGLPRQGLDAP